MDQNKNKQKKPHSKIENIQEHLSSKTENPTEARRATIESCRAKLKSVSKMLKKREELRNKAK